MEKKDGKVKGREGGRREKNVGYEIIIKSIISGTELDRVKNSSYRTADTVRPGCTMHTRTVSDEEGRLVGRKRETGFWGPIRCGKRGMGRVGPVCRRVFRSFSTTITAGIDLCILEPEYNLNMFEYLGFRKVRLESSAMKN